VSGRLAVGLGVVLAAGLLLWPTADAAAQRRRDPAGAFVNLIYAQQFGLGSYSIGGIDVDVFQLPYSHAIDLTPGPDGWQLVPYGYLSYGHIKVDITVPEVGRFVGREDFLLGTPGLELVIPVRPWWKIKPYGEVGLGSTLRNPVAFYTYTIGLTNLFEFRLGDFQVSLGHTVAWAGDDAFQSGSEQEAYATFDTGVEVRHPLGFTWRDITPDVGVFFVHYYFTPPATFARVGGTPLEVSNQFEFGLTVGSATPFKLLGVIDSPRVGVSYRFGDGLTGVRVSFGFPF
jgi:hypothetical protein